ncbi:transferase [Nitrosospira lacus]|uniref:Transferase n=1 Tax=Nitrosospira lacus TaxID=1288494 RepID=A0A1W6SMG4_9PROT|nr:DapH/DapD/GlmU-related protein [Nitrosospira lacus]ARO86993.1 transferase [Nitrosospira lacus]
MRKITPLQITLFFLLFGGVLILGIATAYRLLGALPLGDFRGIAVVGSAVVFIYLYAFAVYRLFLHFMPLSEGELAEGSREEFAAQVNALFYLMLFNSLIRTHFLPAPLMRLVYQALGARMGANTYSVGALLDPPLTELGANCIIGHDAVLFCHAIEGRHFSLARIRAGNNVTIGATAVIMPGVNIGDGAIVSAGAVVLKNTRIGPNEVWGGVPAKRLR